MFIFDFTFFLRESNEIELSVGLMCTQHNQKNIKQSLKIIDIWWLQLYLFQKKILTITTNWAYIAQYHRHKGSFIALNIFTPKLFRRPFWSVHSYWWNHGRYSLLYIWFELSIPKLISTCFELSSPQHMNYSHSNPTNGFSLFITQFFAKNEVSVAAILNFYRRNMRHKTKYRVGKKTHKKTGPKLLALNP